MKKVFVLSNNLNGLFCFRRELIERLLDPGFSVTISAPKDDERASYFASKGCEIIETQMDSTGKSIKEDCSLFSFYLNLLKKRRPDIVLTYTIKPNLYGGLACRLLKIKQIANVTGLGSVFEKESLLRKFVVGLYRLCLKKTAVVFFQNKDNLQFALSHRMTGENSVLIPGSGVNLEYHSFKPYPEKEAQRFIFISRLIKEKGIDLYVDSAKQIKQEYPDVEFHVVGRMTPPYEELIRDCEEKGFLIYHGFQWDIRPYLENCHCTVHPTYYPEGMSNVLLESCAAGRPVITTDQPGCREIVEDGVTGYIIKPKDQDDLKSRMVDFIKLPYAEKCRMGQYAREKVAREFDREIVTRAYMDAIAKL